MTYNVNNTPLFDATMPESPFKELMKRLSHITAKNCPYSEMSLKKATMTATYICKRWWLRLYISTLLTRAWLDKE